MNIEQLKAEVARLILAIEALESAEVLPVEEVPDGPLVLGDDQNPDTWNFWEEYYRLKQDEVTPLAPVLEIPEFAEQYGDWFFDDDSAFIYKPILDTRKSWLVGGGMYETFKDDPERTAQSRIDWARWKNYAALTNPLFALKYVTLPGGYPADPGYLDWMRLIRNQSQRTKIGVGWRSGFATFPVYGAFDSDAGSNAMDNYIATPESLIRGLRYIHGGNLLGEETLIDGHERACKAFEKWWSAGQRRIIFSAKWELRMLDRRFNELNIAGKEVFLVKNPGYEPL